MPFARGTRLGPYEIDTLLGAGGMGEVYRARDERLQRFVALKFLPVGPEQDAAVRRRVRAEARAAAALDHPYICKVHEIGEAEGRSFIAMECISGQTLRARLVQGPLPLNATLSVATEIAEALDAAHRRGVIHRDLKPSNVMIGDDGHVKILDFGLASRFDRDPAGESATQTSPAGDASTTRGTLAYMAPEQLRNQPSDARSDVFSFGVMLYEMLTGVHPFQGQSTFEVASAILKQDPPPWPPAVTPPVLLQHVVRKSLAKDPNERYQSSHDLLIDLRDVTRDMSTASRQTLTIDAGSMPRARTVPRWWLAAAMGLVLGVLGLLWRGLIGRTPAVTHEPFHRQLTFRGDVGEAAMSPDGRTIAYVVWEPDGQRLMVQDVAGGPALEIAREASIQRPRWSPRGDQIAFIARDAEQKFAVRVVSRLGGPSRLLAPGLAYCAWSPDGARLAVATQAMQSVRLIDTAGVTLGTVPLSGFQWLHDLDWHRTSGRLAVLERDPQNRSVIWIAGPDGQEVRPVYREGDIISIRWSPVDDVIYLLTSRNDASELVALDVRSVRNPKARVLMSGLPRGGSLSLSADGTALLHLRETVSMSLARIDLARPREPPRLIVAGTRTFGEPRVSPNGEWITTTMGAGSSTRLVKIPAAGGEPIPLTTDENPDGTPAWSPDGTRLAFGSLRNGVNAVWLVRPDGQQLRRVENTPVSTNRLVDWAPDGQLLWQQLTPGNFLNYRIRDLASGQESTLLPDSAEGWVFTPRWSPRRDKVAVYWNRRPPAKPGLYVLSWPGRVERLLKERALPLGWTADGAWIVATESNPAIPDLWLVSPATGEAKLLTRVPVGVVAGGVVTADGKSLIVTIRDRKGDAWSIENFDPERRPGR